MTVFALLIAFSETANRPLDTPLFPVYLWLTFAGVVVNATIALLIWQQSRSNRITAEAAKASADALMTSERALLIVNYEAYIFVDLAGTQVVKILSAPTPVNRHFLNWHVQNIGKTAAFITGLWSRLIEVRSLSELPEDPDYSSIGEVAYAGDPLGSGDRSDWFSVALEINHQFGSTAFPDIESRYRNRTTYLYAYGYISYRDAFGKERETRFGLVYEAQPQVTYGLDRWKVAGPMPYNKHK